jgi:hypothetical protein
MHTMAPDTHTASLHDTICNKKYISKISVVLEREMNIASPQTNINRTDNDINRGVSVRNTPKH